MSEMDLSYDEYLRWCRSRFPEWSDERADNTKEALGSAKTEPPDSCPVTLRSRDDDGYIVTPKSKGSL